MPSQLSSPITPKAIVAAVAASRDFMRVEMTAPNRDDSTLAFTACTTSSSRSWS